MSRRLWQWLVGLGLVMVAVMLFLAFDPGGAGPSVLSPGAEGLLAARRYLEARGTQVDLLDQPFSEYAGDGVLVTAFPWRQVPMTSSLSSLLVYLHRGGSLLVAYSGRETRVFLEGESPLVIVPHEVELLESLGLEIEVSRARPPFSPLAWRRHARADWHAKPEGSAGGELGPLVMKAPDSVPLAPAGARVWYRHKESQLPVVFSFEYGGGQVVVVPATVLGNARLGQGGNADLVESLRTWFGADWTFDEYHHGLVRPQVAQESAPRGVFDLFALHLGLLYALALLTLGRRFGPPWREPVVRSGSTAAFLRGLGALHDRLRHHGAAGQLLLERIRLLEPHFPLGAEEEQPEVTDGAGLVALARHVAELRYKQRS